MQSELIDLPFGIRDFIYIEENNLIFVALSDMNIASRLDAYLSNTTLPWEQKVDSHVTVGTVIAFKVVNNDQGRKYEKLWVITYPVQTGCLSWESTINMLTVGFDDGKIICYKVSRDSEFKQYNEMASIQAHSDRVMGVALEAKTGYIYSASTDTKLVTSEMNCQEKITGYKVTRNDCGYRWLQLLDIRQSK